MPTDDRQLVRRSLAGEHAAFGALYDRHAPRVFHLLRRLTNHVADAEDLTQETFLATFGALVQWRSEGQFGTWLCGIAFRQYAAARRRTTRQEIEPLNDDMEVFAPDTDPLTACTREEAQVRIEAAISALPELCREAFVLVKVEGLSYRQAAAWLEIPVGTLQSRLWRARRLLQSALSEEFGRDHRTTENTEDRERMQDFCGTSGRRG